MGEARRLLVLSKVMIHRRQSRRSEAAKEVYRRLELCLNEGLS